MQLVILAGGLGTRLGKITSSVPKAMIPVGGKPFLQYQIELAKKYGIKNIVICAGYLSNQIEKYFKDGKKFGVRIRYSVEGEKLLGTAGALRRALKYLERSFMVMYGDSYLQLDFRKAASSYVSCGKPALMTVYRNRNRLDRSNVVIKGGIVAKYDKNLKGKKEYIDYGLSVLDKKIIEKLPLNSVIQLEDVFAKLAAGEMLAAYKVSKPFYEIGSAGGLERFRKFSKELII